MDEEVSDSRVERAYNDALQLRSVIRAREILVQKNIKKLAYHNEAHTLDVIHESALFALSDEISEAEQQVLFIAAAWHDVGFLNSRKMHEEESVKLFREEFQNGNLPDVVEQDVPLIEQMILDTKVYILPDGAGSEQKATTDLSRYLLDADLSNLGRADFFDCFERLCEETESPPLDYHIATLGLLSRHRWFTPIAESLRLEREMQNARVLVERIKRLMKT